MPLAGSTVEERRFSAASRPDKEQARQTRDSYQGAASAVPPDRASTNVLSFRTGRQAR